MEFNSFIGKDNTFIRWTRKNVLVGINAIVKSKSEVLTLSWRFRNFVQHFISVYIKSCSHTPLKSPFLWATPLIFLRYFNSATTMPSIHFCRERKGEKTLTRYRSMFFLKLQYNFCLSSCNIFFVLFFFSSFKWSGRISEKLSILAKLLIVSYSLSTVWNKIAFQ